MFLQSGPHFTVTAHSLLAKRSSALLFSSSSSIRLQSAAGGRSGSRGLLFTPHLNRAAQLRSPNPSIPQAKISFEPATDIDIRNRKPRIGRYESLGYSLINKRMSYSPADDSRKPSVGEELEVQRMQMQHQASRGLTGGDAGTAHRSQHGQGNPYVNGLHPDSISSIPNPSPMFTVINGTSNNNNYAPPPQKPLPTCPLKPLSRPTPSNFPIHGGNFRKPSISDLGRNSSGMARPATVPPNGSHSEVFDPGLGSKSQPAPTLNLGRFQLAGSARQPAPTSRNTFPLKPQQSSQQITSQKISAAASQTGSSSKHTSSVNSSIGYEEDYFDDDFDLDDPSLLELINTVPKLSPATAKAKNANIGPPAKSPKSSFAWAGNRGPPSPSRPNWTSNVQNQPSQFPTNSQTQPPSQTQTQAHPSTRSNSGPFVGKVASPSAPTVRPGNSQPPVSAPSFQISNSPSKASSVHPKISSNAPIDELEIPLSEPPQLKSARTPLRVSFIGQKREIVTPKKESAATTPKKETFRECEPELNLNVGPPQFGATSPGPTLGGSFASSETPLPWSSSPAFPDRALGLAGDQKERLEVIEEEKKSQAVQAPATTKPAKKRKLPWMDETAGGNGGGSTPFKDLSHSAPTIHLNQNTVPDAVGDAVGDADGAQKNTKVGSILDDTSAEAISERQRSMKVANANKKNAMRVNETGGNVLETVAKTPAKIFLSGEQEHVLNLVVSKQQSVFFTGSAGTGKSVLLREIIGALRKKYAKDTDRIAVTASTGLAACNIGGVTLHSFGGIGLGKENPAQLVKKIKRNPKAKIRWMRTKVLVLDEVSMVDAELFDKLEEVARILRNNGRPFGGIQLVVTGDFFQLPPVGDGGKEARFAFDAGSWNTSIDHTIGLHHVFRQKDPVFAEMLNQMREGKMSADSIRRFYQLQRPLQFKDSLAATELFPTRREVEYANGARMSQLAGKVIAFTAHDGGTISDITMRTKLLDSCMAAPVLSLKKGSQVMLIKNMDESLVNGSVGTVRGFMTPAMWNFVCESGYELGEDGEGHGNEAVYPDQEELLTKATEGQPRKIAVALMNAATSSEALPLVRFKLGDGTCRDLLCNRETWSIEQPNGEVQASRSQIPLILAWALSIHKAQGQTLERVKVDLGKVFERGQAYVALSRATTMDGLQVSRFSPQKVVVHERVRDFYAGLSRIEAKEKRKKGGEVEEEEVGVGVARGEGGGMGMGMGKKKTAAASKGGQMRLQPPVSNFFKPA